MRRPPDGQLLANEERVLIAAHSLTTDSHSCFHGYALAGAIRQAEPHRRAMAYSTLYRCLNRLSDLELVQDCNDELTESSGGPPRRHYSLTTRGRDLAERLHAEGGESSLVH